MNNPTKGQAAVEVLAYASFFLLVFVMVSAVFMSAQAQELTHAENAYAQEIAYGFSDNVRTSFIAGPGFSQTISLPPNLLGKPYTLRISSTQFSPDAEIRESGFVFVEWQGQANPQSFAAPLVANYFDAIPATGVIEKDQQGTPVTTFITIHSGSKIKLSNVRDTDGKSIILIEQAT